MKKVIFALALMASVVSCSSGTTNKPDTNNSQGISSGTNSSAAMPDTTATTNQSGATGNGGVGTGAVNGTGEESSGAGKPKQK